MRTFTLVCASACARAGMHAQARLHAYVHRPTSATPAETGRAQTQVETGKAPARSACTKAA